MCLHLFFISCLFIEVFLYFLISFWLTVSVFILTIKQRCDVTQDRGITQRTIRLSWQVWLYPWCSSPPLCARTRSSHLCHSARHVRSNYSRRLHAGPVILQGQIPPAAPRAPSIPLGRFQTDVEPHSWMQTCLWSASSWTSGALQQQQDWSAAGCLLN